MNGDPVISVLIPTYNYARYLGEAVGSVLAQEIEQIEIVIADDASTDDTATVCAELASRDRRIRFHRHPVNIGMVNNWNWCLREARGRFVKYVLADDALHTGDALVKMAAVLEERPEVALVTSSRLVMDEQSNVINWWKPLGDEDALIPASEWVAAHIEDEPSTLNSIGEPTAVMFRADDARRGFDVSMRQLVDLEMWLHVLGGRSLYYLAEPLCRFRRHALQQTEVNKTGHVHKQEEVELCYRYCPERSRRHVLFRKMQRMKKYDVPAYRPLIDRIRADYGPLAYAAEWGYYRAWRLKANLQHSWNKRMKKEAAP